MPDITLTCWTCGKQECGEINRLPSFGFELVEIANQAGLIGKLDMNRGRALVFCSDKCVEKAKTKKGTFRLRPPKKEIE